MKSEDIELFIGMLRQLEGSPRLGEDIEPVVVDEGCEAMLPDPSVRLGGR
jgi:hypothetical protein